MPLEVGDLDRARSRREPSHSEARAALCADALGWRILPSRARLLVHPGSSRDGALPPCHLQTELARERNRHSRGAPQRSEEHTSELRSLIPTSYAVFCLTKKKNKP